MTAWDAAFPSSSPAPSKPSVKPAPSKPSAPPSPSGWDAAFPVSGRLGGMLPEVQAAGQKDEQKSKPVYDAVSNAMAIPNVTGALLGARLRDLAAGRPQPQYSFTPGLKKLQLSDPESAEAHFMRQFDKEPASAVNEYFLTSPQTMRQLSKAPPGRLHDVGKHFVDHPKENAALDFAGRILDAGNAGAGAMMKAVTTDAGALTRTASRGLANQIVKRAPDLATHPLVQTLRSAEHLGSFSRWAEVRSAAEDLARLHGMADPTKAGDDAVLGAVNIANSGSHARGVAQKAAKEVFGGLTKGQQFDLMNFIEGQSPLWGHASKLSAEQIALREKLMPRYQAYQKWRSTLDDASQRYRVAGAPRFLTGRNFFSRAGMYKDKADELGEEELPSNPVFEREFVGAKGVSGPRKGTLGQNVHRRYNSHVEATRAGAELLPDASPMKAFEMHAYARTQAARINQQLDKLQDLGLIVPKEQAVPHAIGVTQRVAAPSGFSDFTNLPPDIGGAAVRQFGSDITRNAWVHPAVPSMIQDIAGRSAPTGGLASAIGLVGSAAKKANQFLSFFEVSDPLYHPIFNVSENVASEAPGVTGLVRGATSKKLMEQAEEKGVHLPYATAQSAYRWSRPWSDLSATEKAQRALSAPGRAAETLTRKMLYGGIEPRMATAAYEGLKGRLGESGAALRVRSMLGEPENISMAMQGGAEAFQFPAWTLSQLRRWPGAIASRPYLYNAPQAGIRDVNLSQGRGPRDTDVGKVLPPIVLGKTKRGDFNVLDLPHPANRAVSLIDAAVRGDKLGALYAAGGAVNPLAQGPVYSALQNASSQTKRDLASVAPEKSAQEQAIDFAKSFGRFSPVRGLTTWPPFSRVELSPERADAQKRLIDSALYGGYNRALRKREPGLVELRNMQHKFERAGKTDAATRLKMSADAMYQHMLNRLTSQGYQTP